MSPFTFLIISVKRWALRAIFPSSSIVAVIGADCIPISKLVAVTINFSFVAVNKIHFSISSVVLFEIALLTIVRAFNNSSL